MTTLICIKTKDTIILAADKQVTQSNIRLPDNFSKIQIVGDNIAVASCGSVGLCQRLLERAIKSIKVEKVLSNDESPITPKELSSVIADLNFNLPLEHKHFQTADFILIGTTGETNSAYQIGSDGSLIEIQSYWADGSGGQLALSLLQSIYDPDEPIQNIAVHINNILQQISGSDIYTNSSYDMYAIIDKKIEQVFVSKHEDKPDEVKT